MSFFPGNDPVPGDAFACDAIEHLIIPRSSDIGGFSVRRALPSVRRRLVGPFIFFDRMGPAILKADEAMDVRPHPHIGLSTVTYLFDGEVMHRDSLGTEMAIHPGDVNWMRAGRGIVHSERTSAEKKREGQKLFGIQTWVALPQHLEESDPDFIHHGAGDLPVVEADGSSARIISGNAWGAASPLKTASETLYADVSLKPGASIPVDASHEERAIYTVGGEIEIAGDTFGEGQLLVFKPGDRIKVTARSQARFMLFGGEPMDGPRYIWWNFVSSRKERIDQAKAEWKAGRFDSVPGDEAEFIPLPENKSNAKVQYP